MASSSINAYSTMLIRIVEGLTIDVYNVILRKFGKGTVHSLVSHSSWCALRELHNFW